MAYCSNCGIEIPSEDKTKLCDKCKRILLPFVKFMDASTSSAVRRLISNEQNLRNAGVTDTGMDYLMRICQIHDRQKLAEKKAKEEGGPAASVQNAGQNAGQTSAAEPEAYSEEELPMDEPLDLHRKPYGRAITLAETTLILAGAAMIAVGVMDYIAEQSFNLASLAGGCASFAASYVADVVRRLVHDIDEIKKHFR